ncbi:MAG: hypothetical protein E7602_05760 [Ruminococcaceae bacterium]|nr:hypothetical protein [Oscillospiraceae bacterium]
MDKFKITEEEINQTILHSPYSLADSPAGIGLNAKEVKKYFYQFIRVFANKINIHLNDIGKTLENYDELCTAFDLIDDLQETDKALGLQITTSINEHNQKNDAHMDIREKIENELLRHDVSVKSHEDIRKTLKSLLDKADVAYRLASGKSRVYSCEDVFDVIEYINENSEIHAGDLFLVANQDEPDFTVFEAGLSNVPNGAEEIDVSDLANGEMEFVSGKSYYFGGVRLVASYGNLETSLLAKNEDLEALENELFKSIEETENSLSALESALALKENATEMVETSEQEITLFKNVEYILGLITSLAIALPEETSGIESIVNFRTGAGAPSFDAPSEIVFSGDDCSGGRFYPITHRIYEINVKEVMGILSARVGATDYEVIE